jgi:hypothetical protein
MNRKLGIARLATTLLVSGGLGLAGLGLTAGTAQAGPFYGPSYEGGNCPPGVGGCTHWCPGDTAYSWSQMITWDWNVCHDFYWNSEGVVDIATNIVYPWHGVPHDAGPPPPPPPPYTPPPPQPLPPHCPFPFPVPFFVPSECGGL